LFRRFLISKPIAAYFHRCEELFCNHFLKGSRYLKLRTGVRHAMKQEEARRLLIEEWDKWIRTQPVTPDKATGRESLKFFLELKDARSPLLKFQAKVRDKWPIIHRWLLDQNRVFD
jgi:hypothetical protein